MKAAHRISANGQYELVLAPPPAADGSEVPPFWMQLYRNRVRLSSTESLPRVTWKGYLKQGDLIEANGEHDVALTVTEIAPEPHSAVGHGA